MSFPWGAYAVNLAASAGAALAVLLAAFAVAARRGTHRLTGALRGLLAVAESYPQLQASQQFTELQGSLRETEDALQNARRYYNAVVRDLNMRVQTAPTNLVAAAFGLKQRPFFDASPADREAVAVRF